MLVRALGPVAASVRTLAAVRVSARTLALARAQAFLASVALRELDGVQAQVSVWTALAGLRARVAAVHLAVLRASAALLASLALVPLVLVARLASALP